MGVSSDCGGADLLTIGPWCSCLNRPAPASADVAGPMEDEIMLAEPRPIDMQQHGSRKTRVLRHLDPHCRTARYGDKTRRSEAHTVVEAPDVQAIDYFAEGALLEGIDVLPLAEASDRLTELGICHEFAWASDLLDQEERGAFRYKERWCTVPPVVRQREYDDATRAPRAIPRWRVARWPFTVTKEGYVKIYVEDLEPRERREQPPAGWDCPTY